MMNYFRNWYVRNQDAISWFIIGWMTLSAIRALSVGNYFWAAIDTILVYITYKLIRIRIQ